MEVVGEFLEIGKVDIESIEFKKVNYNYVNLLEVNLKRFVGLGYIVFVVKEGKNMEVKIKSEKEEFG